MTQEEKEEFVKKIQNNTQPKKIGIKSMINQQKKVIRDNKKKVEREKLNNDLPKEITPIGIIHLQRKKMSSKDCLLKHLRDKELTKRIRERCRNNNITIVKAKDVR